MVNVIDYRLKITNWWIFSF